MRRLTCALRLLHRAATVVAKHSQDVPILQRTFHPLPCAGAFATRARRRSFPHRHHDQNFTASVFPPHNTTPTRSPSSGT